VKVAQQGARQFDKIAVSRRNGRLAERRQLQVYIGDQFVVLLWRRTIIPRFE
jgi:hypothetical protein